jgi:radical SAM protein with 4Fe4S-binding SPASM domain
MGEPLLHPLLGEFLDIARKMEFKVILTTNGTLLKECKSILLSSGALHKVSISLHAYEANCLNMSIDEYLAGCFEFCKDASKKGIISVMRLWNAGGEDSQNPIILKKMREFFGDGWSEVSRGYKISPRLFLEWGEKFEWPDEGAEVCSANHSCYGLRDQVGVLSDGRVVPCCLDADGVITLGNIFEESLSDILAKPRAVALKRSFEERKIKEPLCLRCDFATKRVK